MKKVFLTFILSVACMGSVFSDEPIKGVIATYDGADASYKLEEVPTVKYETQDGVKHAVLYLKGVSEPVLRVALADGKKLEVFYCEHSTGVGEAGRVRIEEKGGRKYVRGGRLVIIDRSGRKYDASGVEIK